MTMRLRLLASRPWRIALGILAIALPATADAPKNPPQYDQFAGDALEIRDRFTGLVWDRRRVQGGLNESGGQLYCSLTVFPGSGRLPSVKELLTLVDEDPHKFYEAGAIRQKSIDQNAFPDSSTPTDLPYWTSTPAPGGKFWTVEFASGKTEPKELALKLNVRCVK